MTRSSKPLGLILAGGLARRMGGGDKLRITIDYEDEAGYQWRRTDISQPRRIDDAPQPAMGTELWWRLD